ncbi:hypothetical protein MHYP_G00049520 [Metynnis hypsauchen]
MELLADLSWSSVALPLDAVVAKFRLPALVRLSQDVGGEYRSAVSCEMRRLLGRVVPCWVMIMVWGAWGLWEKVLLYWELRGL